MPTGPRASSDTTVALAVADNGHDSVRTDTVDRRGRPCCTEAGHESSTQGAEAEL